MILTKFHRVRGAFAFVPNTTLHLRLRLWLGLRSIFSNTIRIKVGRFLIKGWTTCLFDKNFHIFWINLKIHMVPPLVQNWTNTNAIGNANASGAYVCVCVRFFQTQPTLMKFQFFWYTNHYRLLSLLTKFRLFKGEGFFPRIQRKSRNLRKLIYIRKFSSFFNDCLCKWDLRSS